MFVAQIFTTQPDGAAAPETKALSNAQPPPSHAKGPAPPVPPAVGKPNINSLPLNNQVRVATLPLTRAHKRFCKHETGCSPKLTSDEEIAESFAGFRVFWKVVTSQSPRHCDVEKTIQRTQNTSTEPERGVGVAQGVAIPVWRRWCWWRWRHDFVDDVSSRRQLEPRLRKHGQQQPPDVRAGARQAAPDRRLLQPVLR